MCYALPMVLATLFVPAEVDPAAPPAAGDARSLEGFWFGRGNVWQFVMLFQDGRLIITNRSGAEESQYTVNSAAQLSEIDLVHSDGRIQRGVYRLDGSTLQLTLADPELERPSGQALRSADAAAPARYLFSRQPTAESFETLVTRFPKEGLDARSRKHDPQKAALHQGSN